MPERLKVRKPESELWFRTDRLFQWIIIMEIATLVTVWSFWLAVLLDP